MAKYVCKDCGGTNELTLGAEETVKAVEKNLAALIEKQAGQKVDFTPIFDRLDALKQPQVIQTSCEEHPELCQHAEPLEQALAELAEWKTGRSHAILTADYIEQETSCPGCKAGIEEFIGREVKKRGLVKPEPPAPVAETKAAAPEPPKAEDDDIPPWRRG